MPNLAQILKLEIARIARKESKIAINKLKSPLNNARKAIIVLKKRLALLEKEVKVIDAKYGKFQKSPVAPAETDKADKTRISSKTIKAMRKKTGLSQEDFGTLVGVSNMTVYNWERKQGILKFRGGSKGRVLAVKGMGAREARKMVDENKRRQS